MEVHFAHDFMTRVGVQQGEYLADEPWAMRGTTGNIESSFHDMQCDGFLR
jgi:hypothetical protein